MEGFNFSTEITVRFAETDAQGIAHNASYLVWYEVARIAYLARFRGGYRSIQAGRLRGADDRVARPLPESRCSSTTGSPSTRAASTCAAPASGTSTC